MYVNKLLQDIDLHKPIAVVAGATFSTNIIHSVGACFTCYIITKMLDFMWKNKCVVYNLFLKLKK